MIFDFLNLQGEYRKDMSENGQFLYQITNGNKISAQSLKLTHNVNIYNNQNPNNLQFNYPPQDYEGRWIFTFVTIQPQIKKIIIQSDNQATNIQALEIKSNIFLQLCQEEGDIKIIEFKYFQRKAIEIIVEQQLIFQWAYNCRISTISDQEQRVELVKGLQYFDGQAQIQGNFDQFDNKYCITGWIKIDIPQINYNSKMPIIRITVLKIMVVARIQRLRQKNYILTNNLYGLPKYSLQSQYPDLQPSLDLMSCCDYYLNGIPIIKIEEILIQIQFFNELGLQSILIGSSEFQSSFINSKFYYVFGGVYFPSNMPKAWVSDFKFEFNYQNDKHLMNNGCYYSCQTCNGPQQTTCLTCTPHSNRVYLMEEKKFQCQQGYIDYDGQIICMKFENRFPTISQEFVIDQVKQFCQFGYFFVHEGQDIYQTPYYQIRSDI